MHFFRDAYFASRRFWQMIYLLIGM